MAVAALAYISHSKAEKAFGGPGFRKNEIVTRRPRKHCRKRELVLSKQYQVRTQSELCRHFSCILTHKSYFDNSTGSPSH